MMQRSWWHWISKLLDTMHEQNHFIAAYKLLSLQNMQHPVKKRKGHRAPEVYKPEMCEYIFFF